MVGIKKIGLYLLVLFLMASLITPNAYAASGSTADLILYNGIVVTMDQDRSKAEAVAIKADKILAVGTNEKIKTFAGYGTKIIDLQGKMVIPGLVDSHFHLSRAANEVHGVDLNHAESIEDVVQAISKRVEMTLKGEWVVAASNWHEGALKEGRLPNKTELDPVSPDNPVLIPRGGHVITVNSVALDLSGITKDTPNPEGGIIVKDSKTGEPTGVIIGQPATELVKNLLPKQTSEDKVKALEEMMHKVNE
jgi:predicted amidohydrolase YtcJ